MAQTTERPTERCPHGCPEPYVHAHFMGAGYAATDARWYLPIEREWIFTFGYDHFHPETGKNLAHCYVSVFGDVDSSRERMMEKYGRNWAMQYPSRGAANVDFHRMTEVAF